jgi:hypothetical protein
MRILIRAIAVVCVGIGLTPSLFAQELSELEKRNGFKDIKLSMPVDSVKGIKFKKDFKDSGEFDAKIYTVEHPNYDKIGEVSIKKVELKSYKGLIYEITVVTDKDQRLMKALESIYGKAEYDLKNETYFWKSNLTVLKFKSHSKGSLELTYISYLVRNMMKADKGKKVEAIADDF